MSEFIRYKDCNVPNLSRIFEETWNKYPAIQNQDPVLIYDFTLDILEQVITTILTLLNSEE